MNSGKNDLRRVLGTHNVKASVAPYLQGPFWIMTTRVLITGATGDTGRAAARESVALGLDVRAMVHSKDARSEALQQLGAQIVVGDLLDVNTVLAAMKGIDAAYFVWPVHPGLIHATVNFAQAAKEAGVSTVVNLS
jgi:NAD(P)H dehydrogenase (quinone)